MESDKICKDDYFKDYTCEGSFLQEVLKFCDAFYGEHVYKDYLQEQRQVINDYFLFFFSSDFGSDCVLSKVISSMEIASRKYDLEGLDKLILNNKQTFGYRRKEFIEQIEAYAKYLSDIWNAIQSFFTNIASTFSFKLVNSRGENLSDNLFNYLKKLYTSITIDSTGKITYIDRCKFLKYLKCCYDTISRIKTENESKESNNKFQIILKSNVSVTGEAAVSKYNGGNTTTSLNESIKKYETEKKLFRNILISLRE
jgi:hypothetical protein